jgi:hypothetical protein
MCRSSASRFARPVGARVRHAVASHLPDHHSNGPYVAIEAGQRADTLAASLADSVYWTNFADNTIRGAPLAGGGNVDTLYDLAHGALGPLGVAIDAAAGRIYWANQGDESIRGAPLAGGTVDRLYGPGPVVGIASGVTIDPAAPPRIYWTNEIDDTIRVAPLAGGGTIDSLYHGPARGVSSPEGVAIDAAAGRIYWANFHDNTIRGAPLDGSGAVHILYGPAQGVSSPIGVAIEPPSAVRIVPTTRRPSALLSLLSTAVRGILNWLNNFLGRSAAGRIYWTNNGDNTIRVAPLSGGGIVDTLYSGPGRGVNWPNFLAVLRAPLGTGAPAISGAGRLGQPLSCSRGAWAADLLGSYLYRAPQSFSYEWTLNGSDIAGATLTAYTPNAPGSYTCRVTANNRAGSTAQTSVGVAVS